MHQGLRKWASLAVFLVLVAAAAATGGQFEPGDWYAALNRPSFTPPNWVFPIAWTILYVMIAFAGWRIWLAAGMSAPLAVWTVGLILNAAWSYLMFGKHMIGAALVDIYALLAVIIAFIILAWPKDRLASALFIPYALWVSFASVLNFAIWQLNP